MANNPEQEPTLERYELVERIAGGGMGEVFRAVAYGAHGFEKDLAVKRILPRFAQNPEFEKSFVAEAKLAATLNHGNIVQVLDFGRLGGALYLAMEFVDGLDLAALLGRLKDAGDRLPIGVALHIAIELCKGLEFAHRKGIVHRDISPANVLLSRAGEVKIADFGIARAVRKSTSSIGTGKIVGKLRYMSPEQTRGIPLDARSDVFSTAVVLYEAASGRRLFEGGDLDAAMDEVRNKPIPPLSELVDDPPPGLDEVMAAALDRDREQRIQAAGQLLRKLTRLCYSVEPPPTSLDISTIVEESLGEDEAASGGALDDRILAELAGVGVSAEEPSRVTAVKQAGTRETSPQTPRGKGAPNEPVRGKTLTFFRVVAGGGELSSLQLDGDSAVSAVPVDPTLTAGEAEQARSAIRSSTPLWMGAVLVLAIAGAAIWYGTAGRRDGGSGDTGAQVASTAVANDAAATLATPAGDAGESATDAAVAEVREVTEPTAPTEVDLHVTSDPPGAMVTLDGETRLGKTPLSTRLAVDSEDHELSIAKSGFRTETVKVTPDGTPIAVERVLDAVERAPRKGTISLFVHPWADVYLGGRKIARAPVQRLRLPAGKHRLRLVNPVLKIEKSITVTVPRKRPYRVSLKKK